MKNEIKVLIQGAVKRSNEQDKESKRLKDCSAKLDKVKNDVKKLR